MCAKTLIGSTDKSGIAPCPPFPETLILNQSDAADTVPAPGIATIPEGIGIPPATCIIIAASTFGFSRTPASIIAFAPQRVSSAG